MAKHKYIETPEIMWELFLKYVKATKDSPKMRMDFKGKEACKVFYELEVCLTMEGFENYVADIPEYPLTLEQYFSNTNEAFKEYIAICSRITRKIRQDQIEGGMSGIYNPSITQRLNSLVDRKEMDIKGVKPILTERIKK